MSTFALRGRGLDARAMADTLGVARVLDGSIRRDGDRLTVTARLVDPRDSQVLWESTYELDTRNVFGTSDDIVDAVATALQLPAPVLPATAESARPTADPEAYDLYLRGRYAWHLPLRQRLEQGTTYFLRAVERDPGFALAHAALAEAYVNQAVYDYMPAPQAFSRARIAAERALELDPNSVEALVSRGYLSISELRFDDAEADLRRALELNPSSAWAHHFLSLLLIMVGQTEAATAHNRQSLRLDPLSLPAHATAGVLLAQSGALQEAAEQLAAAWVLNREYTLTAYFLGTVLAAQGRDLAALQRLTAARRQAPDYPGVSGAIMLAHRRLGQFAEAESVLVSLQRRDQDPRVRTNLAFAQAMMGYNDEAFRMLNGAQWDVPGLIGLRADPLLAGLRSDPRYREMLQTIMTQHGR